jgi:hypothetical protein
MVNELLAIPRVLDQCCQAKVSDFDVHLPIEEDISEFQVTVDNLMCMHPFASSNELNHQHPGFWFRKSLPTADQIDKRL